MRRHWLLTVLVLCLAFFLGLPSAGSAQDSDTLARMQSEGWKIVKDGVLQRELRPGQVESFVFGVPGFTWKLQDLQNQLRRLRTAYAADPTADLRKAIVNHRQEIANTQKVLALARAAEASGLTGIEKVSCTLSFAYQADASSLTGSQGTWANASASFSSNCAFTGEVYAYAYAKTTVAGAPSTQTVTDGPRSGGNVSATAYASRTGVPTCDSSAYASMTSTSLNPSSYSMSASNASCPAPPNPPGVTVTSDSGSVIDLYEYDCVYITWTTNITPGTAPYTTTMYRNGSSLGARTSYSEWICNLQTTTTQTLTVRSDVVDGASRTGSGSQTTTIRHHYYREFPTCLLPNQECP